MNYVWEGDKMLTSFDPGDRVVFKGEDHIIIGRTNAYYFILQNLETKEKAFTTYDELYVENSVRSLED